MIQKELLLEIGKKKGLRNREHIEKDYFQDLFLFNLFKKTNKFIFKGGTALYKIYGLPRFSEDLDFSLLNGTDAAEAKGIVLSTVKQIKEFEIKSVKKMGDSVLFKISVNGVLTKYNTLRIDASLRNKPLAGFDVKTFTPPYIDINPFSLRLLKTKEMVAEKIHSILNRKKARDLFDLFYLLRIASFDPDLVNRKLGIFGMRFNFKEFSLRLQGLEDVWEKELRPFVLSELFPFAAAKQFVLGEISKTR